MTKRKPYMVCPECGCAIDHGEHCDCEKAEAEIRTAARSAATRKTIARKRRAMIANNQEMMEQAQMEWDYG